jgi:hypothetical protein
LADSPQPHLRILDRNTGEVCAVFNEDALMSCANQGELDIHELNSSEPLLKELVRTSFVLLCPGVAPVKQKKQQPTLVAQVPGSNPRHL